MRRDQAHRMTHRELHRHGYCAVPDEPGRMLLPALGALLSVLVGFAAVVAVLVTFE